MRAGGEELGEGEAEGLEMYTSDVVGVISANIQSRYNLFQDRVLVDAQYVCDALWLYTADDRARLAQSRCQGQGTVRGPHKGLSKSPGAR